MPGFAAVSEFRLPIHRRSSRAGASRHLDCFWGKDVRRPTYFHARRWFLRLARRDLPDRLPLLLVAGGRADRRAAESCRCRNSWRPRATQLGAKIWLRPPDALLAQLERTLSSFSLRRGRRSFCASHRRRSRRFFVCSCFSRLYLSLTIAGQTFFSFQWDILLLETGFLADLSRALALVAATRSAPHLFRAPALFLLQFLLFKLMLMSGVVKLTSGDSSWWNLTALDYHYWTQPLPTVLGWWADKSPEWVKHFSHRFDARRRDRRAVSDLVSAPPATARRAALLCSCKSSSG